MVESKRIYVIAEAGVNHNGSPDLAVELIRAAAAAGADAVKFQTYKTEKMITQKAKKAEYQIISTGIAESQMDMLRKLELDQAAHKRLIEQCALENIDFLSSPFDEESVDLLVDTFQLTRLKIPSGEITNALLLLKAARTGRPVILSTGMSTLAEVENALAVIAFGYTRPQERPSLQAFQQAYYSNEGQSALARKVVLLHCSTEYPAPYADTNLRVMETLKTSFGLPVGYSDHTPGVAVPIAAAALGAVVIEKHFTLNRNLPGPDHQASLEPAELKTMVEAIRQVEAALGSPRKIPVAGESANKLVARKSIVAARDIRRGEIFSEENLTAKRPGDGVSPMRYWNLLGQAAQRDYRQDEQVRE
jgi:N-acetylneuraminate synthase